MRLTFRVIDGIFEKRDLNHLVVKFDLSSIQNKVISQDTRLYVESVDMCDTRVLKLMGYNANDAVQRLEDVGSYLEIRSADIGNTSDWDSSQVRLNTNSTLIYHSPLKSISQTQNNDPMYRNNFKVSQNFLNGTLTLEFLFFDQVGAPLLVFREQGDDYPLFANAEEKFKTMAITLVLYDEIDPIVEASKDSIVGQNMMRIMQPQFKRI